MGHGVDFSWARPGGAAIKASGNDFVCRYMPYLGDGGKGLTADEVADYQANGLSIVLVFESTAGRTLDGFAAGAEDATTCVASLAHLGAPADLPVYFACDFDTTSDEQRAAVDDYLRGCASVIGSYRVGVYGEYELIEHCHEAGTATWYWQTYAWSGNRQSAWRHLYQYSNGQVLNGGAVDFNESYGERQGMWVPAQVSPPAPAPPPSQEPAPVDKAAFFNLVDEFMRYAFPLYWKAYVDGGFTGVTPYLPWKDLPGSAVNPVNVPRELRDFLVAKL